MQEPEEVIAKPDELSQEAAALPQPGTALEAGVEGPTNPAARKPVRPRGMVENFPDPIELDEEIWGRIWDSMGAKMRAEKEAKAKARSAAEDKG